MSKVQHFDHLLYLVISCTVLFEEIWLCDHCRAYDAVHYHRLDVQCYTNLQMTKLTA